MLPFQVMSGLLPIGQLFRNSWESFKQHFSVLIVLFLIPLTFSLIAQVLSMAGNSLAEKMFGLVFSLLSFLISVPTGIAAIVVITEGAEVSDAYRRGFQLFFPSIWVGILFECIMIGGSLLFIIPGVIMLTWFSFSNFVLVIERKRGLATLLQSREYVRGHWWAIFGRFFLFGFLMLLLVVVLVLPLSLVLGKMAGTFAFGSLMAFLTPFGLSYSYELYKNLSALKSSLATAVQTSSRSLLIAFGILGLCALLIMLIGASMLFMSFGGIPHITNSAAANPTTTTTP